MPAGQKASVKTGFFSDLEIVQMMHQKANTERNYPCPTQEAINKEAGKLLAPTQAYWERLRREAKNNKNRKPDEDDYLAILRDLRAVAYVNQLGKINCFRMSLANTVSSNIPPDFATHDVTITSAKEDLAKRYQPTKDKKFYGVVNPQPTRPAPGTGELPERVGNRKRHFDGSELVQTEGDLDDAYDRGGVLGGEINPFQKDAAERVSYDRYGPRGEWWVGPETDQQINEDNYYRQSYSQ